MAKAQFLFSRCSVSQRIDSRRSGLAIRSKAQRLSSHWSSGEKRGSSSGHETSGISRDVSRTSRHGFAPPSRRTAFSNFEGPSIFKCPFRNLPESGKGRWGEGLTAEDMKRCRWLKPQLVAAIEFLEWTTDNRLRHVKFVLFAMIGSRRLSHGSSPTRFSRAF